MTILLQLLGEIKTVFVFKKRFKRFGRPFCLKWYTIQKQRNSTANSARNIKYIRLHKPAVVKNVNALSDVVVMIVSRKVLSDVWSLFSVVQRKHQRRSVYVLLAKDARNHQCIALEDYVSLNGWPIKRRSTPNQHGK